MVYRLSGRFPAFLCGLALLLNATLWAQSQSSTPPAGSSSSTPSADSRQNNAPPAAAQSNPVPANSPVKSHEPEFSPPRSDRVNASDLATDEGESSSRDSAVDLSPPSDDDKAHPKSSEAMTNAEMELSGNVAEFHTWDPHKAAKSVEVGDFYFKRKNYRAAEDRYREALMYKEDDAIATYKLAVCLDKMERPGEALLEYTSYLKILPHGPEAEQAQKAVDRLSQPADQATNSAKKK